MFIILIILVVVLVVVLAFGFGSKRASIANVENNKRRTKVTYEPHSIKTGIADDEVMEIFIAGIEHHCTKADIGPFSGVIFNETDNPVDKKAMAIGDHLKKKIIGYVPGTILSDYRKWCKREKRACVGFIFWDGEHLRGRCRIYPTITDDDMDKYGQDGSKYAQIVAEHFGWELNENGSIK